MFEISNILISMISSKQIVSINANVACYLQCIVGSEYFHALEDFLPFATKMADSHINANTYVGSKLIKKIILEVITAIPLQP